VIGREAELARIAGWLAAAERGDDGGSLLAIEGDPGVGKTTVWREAIHRAAEGGWTILSCRPHPSDASLAHLGLTDLIRPIDDETICELPPPQSRALLIATLRHETGSAPLDPRAVGVGLRALLTAISQRSRLLIAVDDLQWMDMASARALAFALSRTGAHPVHMLITVRRDGARRGAPAAMQSALDPEHWQRIRLGPVSIAALHRILAGVLDHPVPRPLLVRIHRATTGNPFYALEAARELERTGAPPGRPLPVPADQQEMAMMRVRRLPRATRDALARVAAMSRPTTDVVDEAALLPAAKAGVVVVQLDGLVDFTHPLFGSALYSSLPKAERRQLHRELAECVPTPGERARHLALAASGPDEGIATALDRAAESAGARGAADIVVELKELALELTPIADHAAVARRQLELAERRYFAGDANGARQQLERAVAASPPGEPRAHFMLELGSILWSQGDVDGGMALMSQALGEAESRRLLARIHSRLAAMAEDFDFGVEHAEASLALIDETEDPLLYSSALHNAARCKLFAGRGADHDAVERGMRLQREGAEWEVSLLPAYWALYFDDFDTARTRFAELLRVFRDRGDEARCSVLLAHLAVLEALTGNMQGARPLADEALDAAVQTEQETWVRVALWAKGQVAVRSGDLVSARAAAVELLEGLASQPDVTMENMARAVLGLAALSAGDFAEADRQLTRSDEIVEAYHAREPAADRFHADHAEAVISLGELERAEGLVARLEHRAATLPRPWVLAVSARCRGLLHAARGDTDAAARAYERALEAHRSLAMPSELGRTLLAKGRLLRRRKERRHAQDCLTEALRTFERCGAESWAGAAREELRRATGRAAIRTDLTATELAVAQLAASGLRNREIASRMFLAEKTVEANLSRVYGKLDIRSRAELVRRLMPAGQGGPSQ
jgi:DNA-binding CsgD family transcriptional regulator/predicted negative regulator of RcsB-dependent stress response